MKKCVLYWAGFKITRSNNENSPILTDQTPSANASLPPLQTKQEVCHTAD